MSRDEKLSKFLREISNWHWSDFVRAEKDNKYSSNESMIFALIRACAMRKLAAIKLNLSRIDGKIETPVKVEYPKVFYLYPHAKLPAPGTVTNDHGALSVPPADGLTPSPAPASITGELMAPAEPTAPPPEADVTELSIRETISRMADYPRSLPEQITEFALQIEMAVRNNLSPPADDPLVKSVVAANLLILAQNRNIDALAEVFDQIDGKLVNVLKVLGEDIYITEYSETAPPGAYLNEDGILQIEATAVQDMWAKKLGEK